MIRLNKRKLLTNNEVSKTLKEITLNNDIKLKVGTKNTDTVWMEMLNEEEDPFTYRLEYKLKELYEESKIFKVNKTNEEMANFFIILLENNETNICKEINEMKLITKSINEIGNTQEIEFSLGKVEDYETLQKLVENVMNKNKELQNDNDNLHNEIEKLKEEINELKNKFDIELRNIKVFMANLVIKNKDENNFKENENENNATFSSKKKMRDKEFLEELKSKIEREKNIKKIRSVEKDDLTKNSLDKTTYKFKEGNFQINESLSGRKRIKLKKLNISQNSSRNYLFKFKTPKNLLKEDFKDNSSSFNITKKNRDNISFFSPGKSSDVTISKSLSKTHLFYDVNNEINMTYINYQGTMINILGEEFVMRNRNNFFLIINDKKIKLCSSYDFKNLGEHKVKLIIHKSSNNLSNMFSRCKFLYSITNLNHLNTSSVWDMSRMFYGCYCLTSLSDISGWDTSQVINMEFMFYNCRSLKKIPDISKWNISKVTGLNNMFDSCTLISSLPDISLWDTSHVRYIQGMFQYCENLTELPDISKWNTSSVVRTDSVFACCISLADLPNIYSWDTTSLNNSENMFYNDTKISDYKIPKKFK